MVYADPGIANQRFDESLALRRESETKSKQKCNSRQLDGDTGSGQNLLQISVHEIRLAFGVWRSAFGVRRRRLRSLALYRNSPDFFVEEMDVHLLSQRAAVPEAGRATERANAERQTPNAKRTYLEQHQIEVFLL